MIHGRVQGVGYRYYVLRAAQSRGITGWVTNRPDGTVEIEAEGSPESLAALGEDLVSGPSPIRVTRVDRTEIGPLGSTDFEVV